MRKTIGFILSLACCLMMASCSSNQEIPEDQVLYRMNWEGKEITFFETSNLSYTDGKNTYSTSFHMLNSDDGDKRLYVIEDAFGIEYQVLQNGEVQEPIGTFVVKNYEGEIYEKSFELVQRLGVVDDHLVLSNVVAKIYSLDISKPTSLWFDSMQETVARRWDKTSDSNYRGYIVDLDFSVLEKLMSSWDEASVAKNLVSAYTREYLISWENVASNQLIYDNGMKMHVPALNVNRVTVNDEQYIEVENQMDYDHSFTTYYQLTNQQMNELLEWKTSLRK